MNHVELLQVSDTFQFSNIGLTLTPDFPMPDKWKNLEEEVLVVTPTGPEFRALARISMIHLNIPGCGDPKRRWRVIVVLPACTKEQVPVGSRVFSTPETLVAVTDGKWA